MGLFHRVFRSKISEHQVAQTFTWLVGPARIGIIGLLCSGFFAGGDGVAVGQIPESTVPPLPSIFGEKIPSPKSVENVPLEEAVDAESYVLGPGDELTIVIWGEMEASFQVTVNPDGTVIIPTVGSLIVAGHNLAAATDSLIDMIQRPYKSKKVTIALTKVRTFLVSIGGAVNVPGTVEVHGGNRVDAAILAAQGFIYGPKSQHDTTKVMLAAPRLVQVTHTNGKVVNADLERFLRTGNREANPYLQDGDYVEVPFKTAISRQIGVLGAFRSPGIFDYLPTDRLSVAVQLGGGLSSASDVERAVIARFNSDSTWTEIPVNLTAAIENSGGDADMRLQAGDRLLVPWKSNWKILAQVEVIGQVQHPGGYPIIPGQTTLTEVIRQAGGLLPKAALDQAKVIRNLPDKQWDPELERLKEPSIRQMDRVDREYLKQAFRDQESLAVVDFKALFVHQDARQDILMMDGDVIQIPERRPSVEVIGQVMYPGYVQWESGLSWKEYITRAGGFAARADVGRVRVIRGQSNAWTKPSGSLEIYEGDTIFVPEKTIYEGQSTWRYFIEGVAIMTQVATLILVVQNLAK